MQVIELKPVKQIRKTYTPTTYKPPVINPAVFTAGKTKLLDKETYDHRQKIIGDLWRACTYKTPGTLVRPAADETFEKEGLYRIVSVCATWNDYKGSATDELSVKWPVTENPMIVVAINLKTNQNIEATTNYFIPYVD